LGAKSLVCEALKMKGTSEEIIQEILSSLSDSTWKQYNASLKRWQAFCKAQNFQVFEPSCESLLAFLKDRHQQAEK